MGLALEIGVIFVLVLLNGAFAMSELAIVSSRRSRLMALQRQGSAGAEAALALADDPQRFPARVQRHDGRRQLVAGGNHPRCEQCAESRHRALFRREEVLSAKEIALGLGLLNARRPDAVAGVHPTQVPIITGEHDQWRPDCWRLRLVSQQGCSVAARADQAKWPDH